ncbi:MAG: 50S ribosomal protein L10, partial [Clostridia bacterium]
RGISVEDDTKLRKNLRDNNNEYMIVKNSIISHAATNAKIEGVDTVLSGPTAVVINNDEYVSPAKILNDYIKNNSFYKFKAGVMDGKFIDENEVKKIATLPSKDTLYSMVASALLGNIRNLAVVLNEVSKKNVSA